jgi:hypothetical protein
MSWMGPTYICDGRTVYSNAKDAANPLPPDWQLAPMWVTPRSLLSGGDVGYVGGHGRVGDVSYANCASLVYPDLSPTYGWGFEFDPKPADAPGCVLIKRSNPPGHEWYYIDPAKGCAVVRVELFNLSVGAKPASTLPTDRETVRLEDFQLSPQGFWYPKVVRDTSSPADVLHYHFDFDPVLPDSLFVVDSEIK